jgi:hypothetical protein
LTYVKQSILEKSMPELAKVVRDTPNNITSTARPKNKTASVATTLHEGEGLTDAQSKAVEIYKGLIFYKYLAYVNQFRPVGSLTMRMSQIRLKTGRGYILAHDFSIQIDLHQLNQITYIKQYITSTAREFRGTSRKHVIHVSQSDNQILAPLTALVCKKIARACVGESGQQEGLYQRLLKMPQPVGGRTIKQGRKLVHPTGTSISKYRRNQVFHITDSRQGMGTSDPSEIERRLFSAQ